MLSLDVHTLLLSPALYPLHRYIADPQQSVSVGTCCDGASGMLQVSGHPTPRPTSPLPHTTGLPISFQTMV